MNSTVTVKTELMSNDLGDLNNEKKVKLKFQEYYRPFDTFNFFCCCCSKSKAIETNLMSSLCHLKLRAHLQQKGAFEVVFK